MKKDLSISFWVFIIFMSACTHEAEENLFLTHECSTDNISYSGAVLGIMQNKCLGCHNDAAPQGNVSLQGYDKVKKYVDTGELLGSIRFDPGYAPMPKNQSKMVDCDLEKIEVWINQGAPEN